MAPLAGFISEVVDNLNDETVLLNVRRQVNDMMAGKPLFTF